MTTESIRFDAIIPEVIRAVLAEAGVGPLDSGDLCILRDAVGRVTLIERAPLDPERKAALSARLAALGDHIDSEGGVLSPGELFDDALKELGSYSRQHDAASDTAYYFVDRQIIGADWQSSVQGDIAGAPPVIAFASIKGGVGRSTALCVTAQHLSDLGLKVLVIDLDLEAPGLGSFLLTEAERPEFGSLDYFVERHGTSFKGSDLRLLYEASNIVKSSAPVYVVPAFGRSTLRHPDNTIPKLSRAYVETAAEDGRVLGFMARLREMVSGLLAQEAFDVVLIDTRAGLHETLAASLIGLGADLLLFGLPQDQTFEGYLPLMKTLAAAGDRESLVRRLKMVHAKSDPTETDEARAFRDRSHDLFRATFYNRPEESPEEFEGDPASWWNVDDEDGPHFPLQIEQSASFRIFAPDRRPEQLQRPVYSQPFGNLMKHIEAILDDHADRPA